MKILLPLLFAVSLAAYEPEPTFLTLTHCADLALEDPERAEKILSKVEFPPDREDNMIRRICPNPFRRKQLLEEKVLRVYGLAWKKIPFFRTLLCELAKVSPELEIILTDDPLEWKTPLENKTFPELLSQMMRNRPEWNLPMRNPWPVRCRLLDQLRSALSGEKRDWIHLRSVVGSPAPCYSLPERSPEISTVRDPYVLIEVDHPVQKIFEYAFGLENIGGM